MHLFERDGATFVPTGLTRGPWDPNAMNGGAVTALCARAAEMHDVEGAARSDRQLLARLTVDLVRPAPLAPLTVRTATVRPGRKVQLVGVEVLAGGQVVARASALRMRTAELPLPRPAEDGAPPFVSDPARLVRMESDEPYFHSHALEIRRSSGQRPAFVWIRMTCGVVEGEDPTPQQRAAAIADMGSGMSPVVPFAEWTFPNVDVDLHLHRPPRGDWLSLTCSTQAGPFGVGVAVSAMSDTEGRCGQVVQAVLLERR
ncbi:MAG TPA: thioesterase family protein [Acidimicrobiales bacterium]|nr:thioesterase family protein [Acidimicrobiales bacterium]